MKSTAMIVVFALVVALLLNGLHLQSLKKDNLKLSIKHHKLEIEYLSLQLEIINESAIFESDQGRP